MNTVDIILRTRNRPQLLDRALRGIVAQSHNDWQVYLVNDGGDQEAVNNCAATFEAFIDKIQVIHHAVSIGRSPAFIAGWSAGNSPYVAWHDDDDTWHPEFLTTMIRHIQNREQLETGAVVCWTDEIHERIHDHHITEFRRFQWSQPFWSVPVWRLAQRNVAPPIAILLRREAVDDIGGLDKSLPLFEDWDLLLRLHQKYEISVVPQVLAEYHIRPDATAYSANAVSNLTEMAYWEATIRNRWWRNCPHELGALLQQADMITDTRDRIIAQASGLKAIWRKLRKALGK